MSGKTRGMPRIEHPDASSQKTLEEQQPPLQFAIVQQVTILQDQMSTIMEILQRMTAPSPTSEVPPAIEISLAVEAPPALEVPPAVENLPFETIQTHKMTSTNCHSISVNWESILNEKADKAITRKKSRGRQISIKEDPFIEDVMNVPLPSKFKEPTGDFDGTTDPIDHIRTFQDRVRLHGCSDAIVCKVFTMTL
ncbi:uncharacterized protein Fot_06523 [Forsythia ovata]|uniref:Reverse transcriptase domain-containing protein n=1 Tax=Forsythia ovata TaxID=205694 RepID=A0ABD1WTC8_9LAMI